MVAEPSSPPTPRATGPTPLLGIRGSLTLGLAGLLLAAGAIAVVVVVQLVGTEVEAQVLVEQRRRIAAEADALSARCALMTDCEAMLRSAVDRMPRDGIARRTVYNAAARLIAGHADGPPEAIVADVLQGGALDWQRVERAADHPRGEGVDHRIVSPLRTPLGRAALEVVFTLDGLHAGVAAQQRVVMAYLLFDLLAVLLFGVYVSGVALVRPVRQLTAAARRIDVDGADARWPVVRGPRELVQLGEAFHQMIDRLAARQRELSATIARLEATRDELVRSEKLATVGRLAAGVAHEVGNPLAAVQGYVEYLSDPRGVSPEMQARLLGRIDKELGRMQETLRRLLDFSRPTPPSPRPTRPRAVVDAAVELVRYQKRAAAAQIKVDGDPPRVMVDPGRLRQVVVNLLLNALDALAGAADERDEPGRVAITLSTVEAQARIEVADDGPGISAEIAPNLFDPFATTKPAGEGTGLGLAISHGLVDEAGGALTLVSAPDQPGATFRIALPLIDDGEPT